MIANNISSRCRFKSLISTLCFLSNAESIHDDSDMLQPVGFESERFSEMVMNFDHRSSQAANDALQLLKTSAGVDYSQYVEEEGENGYGIYYDLSVT